MTAQVHLQFMRDHLESITCELLNTYCEDLVNVLVRIVEKKRSALSDPSLGPCLELCMAWLDLMQIKENLTKYPLDKDCVLRCVTAVERLLSDPM